MIADIPEIHADKKTGEILSVYLQSNNLNDLCNIKTSRNNKELVIVNNKQQKKYTLPVKIGEIIDQLNIYKNNDNKRKVIKLNGGTLDIAQNTFIKNNEEQIYLTEKEAAIIKFLYANRNSVISRETLLKAIWGYADNVETHTLETHIYRLRQKIELDPYKPEIIVTSDEGYKVI